MDKVFPFTSVYNLWMLAQLKNKREYIYTKSLLKWKQRQIDFKESQDENTKTSDQGQNANEESLLPNSENRIGRWTNVELNSLKLGM